MCRDWCGVNIFESNFSKIQSFQLRLIVQLWSCGFRHCFYTGRHLNIITWVLVRLLGGLSIHHDVALLWQREDAKYLYEIIPDVIFSVSFREWKEKAVTTFWGHFQNQAPREGDWGNQYSFPLGWCFHHVCIFCHCVDGSRLSLTPSSWSPITQEGICWVEFSTGGSTVLRGHLLLDGGNEQSCL